jgi:hypothetical protein
MRSTCDGEVRGDGHQLAVRLGTEGRFEPLVELVEVDTAFSGRLAQHLGDLVTIVVGDSQAAGVLPLQRAASRLL